MTPLTDALREAIARDRQAMVDLTRELIAIPTENPPGAHYDDAITLLLARLHSLRFDEVRREGDCVLALVERAAPEAVRVEVDVLQEARASGSDEREPLGRGPGPEHRAGDR